MGGRYRLLRPVGSGASAHVYVAEDVRLKRRVALKLLHPALATDAAFLRRFQVEAQTVAALRHQGIVRVYDWGEDGGNAYLTMELLEGGSLRSLLDSGHRLSVSQVAALGLDVASALAYAHARGLVHRDVKPANLLFDEEGKVSVADFGIARALAEASWTEPLGAMLGTARYAAPEQLKGAPLDGRADVYSLALVAVEAVTGDVPFARDTTLGALMARADQPLSVPGELGPLAPVIEKAGTAAPEDRLSAEAFAQGIAVVARQLRAPRPCPCRASRQLRRAFSPGADRARRRASPARRARDHHPGGRPGRSWRPRRAAGLARPPGGGADGPAGRCACPAAVRLAPLLARACPRGRETSRPGAEAVPGTVDVTGRGRGAGTGAGCGGRLVVALVMVLLGGAAGTARWCCPGRRRPTPCPGWTGTLSAPPVPRWRRTTCALPWWRRSGTQPPSPR